MKISGIYKIQSKIHPDRIYIGSSINIPIRFTAHRNRLKRNKHHSPKLQDHFNKYGVDDIIFEIIEETLCDKESLILREQYYLDTMHPWFNICTKADSNMGHICSDYVKEQVSKANKGRPGWNKGKSPSPETILKMIESRHKRPLFSQEYKDKIGKAQLGRKRSIETKIKMSKKRKLQIPPMLGKKHSEETKKLMSLKTKSRPNWKGRKLSEEHKKNILIARKKYFENKKLKVA